MRSQSLRCSVRNLDRDGDQGFGRLGRLAHGARVLEVAIGLTPRQPEPLRQLQRDIARRHALSKQRVGDIEALDLLGACRPGHLS